MVCLYAVKRFERRRTWIFSITSAIYLVYMAGAGIVFAFANQAWRSYFGPASWVFLLIVGTASPLASLFFISLPPLVMLELMIVFLLVFLVILPLGTPAGNLWDLISEATTSAIESESSVFAVFSYAEERGRYDIYYDFSQAIIMLVSGFALSVSHNFITESVTLTFLSCSLISKVRSCCLCCCSQCDCGHLKSEVFHPDESSSSGYRHFLTTQHSLSY